MLQFKLHHRIYAMCAVVMIIFDSTLAFEGELPAELHQKFEHLRVNQGWSELRQSVLPKNIEIKYRLQAIYWLRSHLNSGTIPPVFAVDRSMLLADNNYRYSIISGVRSGELPVFSDISEYAQINHLVDKKTATSSLSGILYALLAVQVDEARCRPRANVVSKELYNGLLSLTKGWVRVYFKNADFIESIRVAKLYEDYTNPRRVWAASCDVSSLYAYETATRLAKEKYGSIAAAISVGALAEREHVNGRDRKFHIVYEILYPEPDIINDALFEKRRAKIINEFDRYAEELFIATQ